jgi:TetR/AcrR family transcriptional repressor of lmrAB and yxaGH operons
MIETTVSLLELQGYHATGLNQILEESSAPKGSLYFHFPGGKQELAVEAIVQAGAVVKAKVSKVLQEQEDLGTAIKAFITTIACDLEKSDFRKGCPVANVAAEASAMYDKLRSACEKVYESWFVLVQERLLAAGLDEAEAENWTIFIWSAVEGALLLSRNRRSTVPLDVVAQQLETVLSGLQLNRKVPTDQS